MNAPHFKPLSQKWILPNGFIKVKVGISCQNTYYIRTQQLNNMGNNISTIAIILRKSMTEY